jgi:hypothetical protein
LKTQNRLINHKPENTHLGLPEKSSPSAANITKVKKETRREKEDNCELKEIQEAQKLIIRTEENAFSCA